MPTSLLVEFENDLSIAGDYEIRKFEATAAVVDFFKRKAGTRPDSSAVQGFYSGKNYTDGDIDLSIEGHSRHALDLAFVALMQSGIYAESQQNFARAQSCFSKAKQISDLLQDGFYSKQYDYLSTLTATALDDKLCIEMCYEKINAAFLNDPDEAFRLIGLGLQLAEAIADQKRKYDFLGKAQYAFSHLLEPRCYHTALSLGCYCRSAEVMGVLGAEYKGLIAWSQYRAGNIYIELGFEEKKTDDMDAAIKMYTKAKTAYQQTLNWALAGEVWYAVMLLYERLGVANCRLKRYDAALLSYEKSLEAAQKEGIAPLSVEQNAVRYEIGRGNIYVESAQSSNREQNYAAAGRHYLNAYQLANKINYSVNKKIAIFCIQKLYDEWPGYIQEQPAIKDLV